MLWTGGWNWKKSWWTCFGVKVARTLDYPTINWNQGWSLYPQGWSLYPSYFFCSQPWIHSWFSSYLLWSDLFCLSFMFLPHSWSPSHPCCSWLRHGTHHWHISCTLQTWLLQFPVLLYCLPKSQLRCLQHIQNALTRAVVAAPRSSNPDYSPIAPLAQGTGTH